VKNATRFVVAPALRAPLLPHTPLHNAVAHPSTAITDAGRSDNCLNRYFRAVVGDCCGAVEEGAGGGF